jgi:hypothetical protein
MKELNEILNKIYKNLEVDENGVPTKWSKQIWSDITKEINPISKNLNPIKVDFSEYEDFKEKTGFYSENRINNIGGYINLKSEYKEYLLSKINNLEFVDLYPQIFKYLYLSKQIEIDENIAKPYIYILDNKDKISKNNKLITRIYLNYLYGYLLTKQDDIKIDNVGAENITYFTNFIMSQLDYKLGKNSVYVDTDQIFYLGDKNIPSYIIKEIFGNYNIPYDISTIDNVIFFKKKKYIIANNGELKISGFRSYNLNQ